MRVFNSTWSQLTNIKTNIVCLNTCLVLLLGQSLIVNADALLDIDGSKEKFISPQIKQTEFKPSKIDSENFEVLAYAGTYDFDSFDTRPIYGFKGSFHFNRKLFLDIDYGNSNLKGRTNPSDPTTTIDENIIRYDAGLGINLMQGDAFWKKGEAFKNQLYIKYSLGKIDIDSQKSSFNSLGLGVRLLHPNDMISLQAGFNKDSVENSGGNSSFSNLKFFTGIGFFF
jgi:outer membrane beta-barrel protein